jgi:hypothetical protein
MDGTERLTSAKKTATVFGLIRLKRMQREAFLLNMKVAINAVS